MIEVKRIAKEWEIWDKEEEAVKSEAEAYYGMLKH